MKNIDPERMARKMAEVLAAYETPRVEFDSVTEEEKTDRELQMKFVFPAVDLEDLRRRLLLILYEEHLSALGVDLGQVTTLVDGAINSFLARRAEVQAAFRNEQE